MNLVSAARGNCRRAWAIGSKPSSGTNPGGGAERIAARLARDVLQSIPDRSHGTCCGDKEPRERNRGGRCSARGPAVETRKTDSRSGGKRARANRRARARVEHGRPSTRPIARRGAPEAPTRRQGYGSFRKSLKTRVNVQRGAGTTARSALGIRWCLRCSEGETRAATGKVCGVVEDSKIETGNLERVGVLVTDKVEPANIERRLPAETRAQGASRCYRRNTIGRFWLQ